LAKFTLPKGWIAYGYDETTGRTTEMSTSLSSTKYDYDVLGRLTVISETKRNGNNSTPPVLTKYGYSKDGLVETVGYEWNNFVYRDTKNEWCAIEGDWKLNAPRIMCHARTEFFGRTRISNEDRKAFVRSKVLAICYFEHVLSADMQVAILYSLGANWV
jgi:hypothetical protein